MRRNLTTTTFAHESLGLPFAAVFQHYRVMPTWFLLKNPPAENTRRQQRIHQAAEKTVEQMENLLTRPPADTKPRWVD
jgi:hypothetical protein